MPSKHAGVVKANEYVAQAKAIMEPSALKGSDLSVLIDKIKEWVSGLDISSFGGEAIHILLHYVADDLLPKLAQSAPTYAALLITVVVIPLLKKLDENFHPVVP